MIFYTTKITLTASKPRVSIVHVFAHMDNNCTQKIENVMNSFLNFQK